MSCSRAFWQSLGDKKRVNFLYLGLILSAEALIWTPKPCFLNLEVLFVDFFFNKQSFQQACGGREVNTRGTCEHAVWSIHYFSFAPLFACKYTFPQIIFPSLCFSYLLSVLQATVHSCTCCCEIVWGFMGNGFDEREKAVSAAKRHGDPVCHWSSQSPLLCSICSC